MVRYELQPCLRIIINVVAGCAGDNKNKVRQAPTPGLIKSSITGTLQNGTHPLSLSPHVVVPLNHFNWPFCTKISFKELQKMGKDEKAPNAKGTNTTILRNLLPKK